MSVFENIGNFFETRLDEFLRNHPHLQLQALEEQLREQEEDTLKLIRDFQIKEKQLQEQILATAEEIQRWHARIAKASSAGREDLARAAQEREAALLRQGNQLWGQMQGVKERIEKAKEIYRKIQGRRKEVQAKAAETTAARAKQVQQDSETKGWNQSYQPRMGSSFDDLELEFRRLETEDELERMKRNMGR
ncbi:MAG: TIGR04376 family protein [Oscillatoriaceae cyanobacterium]